MRRYTEYHCGKAVIKDKKTLLAAIEVLAKIEDLVESYQDRWISAVESLPPEPTEGQHKFGIYLEYLVKIYGATRPTALQYVGKSRWIDQSGNPYPVMEWREIPE